MGCAQSKIEQEEAVMRCKNRRRLMADAVAARNHFAAAHSAYTILLKTTGGALSDYARGEAPDPSSSSSAVAAASMSAPPAASTAVLPPAPRDNLSPPPPPPFADFSPGSLQRSSSTPNIPIPDPKASRKPPAGAAIREEGDGEDEDEDGHIRTDSDDDDYNDDDEDDHHEHDDVDVDEVAHGHRKGNMDSMASSPAATPQPPPQLNPSPPTPASTPPLPISHGMGTWDYFFGTEPMPPPTLAQHDEEPWMGRREQDAAPEVETPPPMRPIPKLVVNDETVEERPRTALEKAKAIEELAAQLPPSKPIVKKPPKPPVLPPVVQYQHAASMVSTEARKGKIVVASGSANLMQTVAQLDDQFLKASESAYEVSKNLEATRMHYHSNHADSRGHIDHSAKIMHVITWNRSFKNLPGHDDMNDNFETDERFETHATILDKMLAWEKKLYDEVKAGELMKIDYQKKVALLHKQKKRGVKHEILEKTKAAVSHLHTRYIVDMQSMDSTVSEINRLRDKQLYPKLVDLVDGMAKMWNAMSYHHKKQLKIILGIRSFDIPPVSRETSDLHFKQTSDLHDFVMEWHSQFEKLMTHQKEYIRALNAWLKLNLIPIESSLKEKVSSPPRQVEPPIKDLLHAWQDQLERLPIELAKNAIKSFAEVINNILRLQEEEVDLRRRCEGTRRDLNRRIAQFEDWHRKYLERRASQGEDANPEDRETLNPDPVVGRKIAVQEVEIRLKEEQEHHRKFAAQVREKSLANLRVHLPDLFRNMADFASFCGDMYIDLKISAAQLKDVVEG